MKGEKVMLEFKVDGQKLERTDNTFVVSDSKNYLTAQFTLSEEWTGEVTAVFGNGDKFFNQPLKENKCVVPWEVIKAPFFTVSVFCGELITANMVKIMVEKSGFVCGEVPGTPTPTVWNSYLAEMAKCLETAWKCLQKRFSSHSVNISQNFRQ